MAEVFAYYGFRYDPFEKENANKGNAFHSRDFREAYARLDSLSKSRGLGVFTAGPGNGKTMAIRCFMEDLNPNLYMTGYIALSTVTVGEFYRQWCDLLGVEKKGGKPGMLRNMKEQIPPETVMFLIQESLLYQDTPSGNAVFVSPDEDYCEIRGTGNRPFHGCRKRSSDRFWYFLTDPKPEMAYVCEAAIDAVSLMLIHKAQGITDPAVYVSIGGVANQQAIDRLKKRNRRLSWLWITIRPVMNAGSGIRILRS